MNPESNGPAGMMRPDLGRWAGPASSAVSRVPSRAWDVVVLALVLAVPGWWYSSRWLDLFPLVEFRQQANFDLPLSWLWDQITLNGPNIWSVPFYFNSTLGHVCGTNVECYNASLLLVNLITASLLYTLVRRFAPWRILAAAAATIWLLGIPVLDSMTWQATNLDKLSALLVLIGLHVGLSFFRRPFTIRRCLTANVLLFLVVVLAQNCKPAAWVLVPALLLMPLIPGGQGIRTWWRYLVAPAIYAVVQSVYVLRLINGDAFYSNHVSSGDVPYNLRTYLGYLTGLLELSTASLVFGIVLALAVIAGLVRRVEHGRLAAWLLIVFAGALAIPMRTQYLSPFYMMVSAALFSMLVVVVLLVLTELTPSRWKLVPTGLAILCAVGYLGNIAETRHQYDIVETQSANFRDALPILAQHVPRDDRRGLVLVIDDANFVAYRFAPNNVEQFIYGNKTGFDSLITLAPRSQFKDAEKAAIHNFAVFDEAMHLRRVVVNGNDKVREPGRPS